ncbi:dynein axonemal heavy chain 6-like isoform X2 [Saccostrea cucullata]|uniref:dynein axonemal heavy chain 6-like isoform X2 n=1 Tax=Saccostrea cuccullata TaxID=36930 RepID=UPI002ED6637C
MAYRQTNGLHRSMNDAANMNGSGMNGATDNDQMTASQPMGLRGIDPESLKSRLISFAPQQAAVNTKALRFNRVTQSQMKKSFAPLGPKLEPVPSLQKYQERNHPTYIQNQNRIRLESQGVFKKDEPSAKKMKRAGSVEPMDKPESPLPELPGDLQQKQASMVLRVPTPPSEPKPVSPRGKAHTSGPKMPASTKAKIAETHEGLNDADEIIRLTKEDKRIGFLYLSPNVPKSSVKYHYYNLRVVNHQNINHADYCTISQEGVTRMRNDDETEFVTLDRWEQEYNYFKKIIKIKTFALFRKWKAFNVWRKNVRTKKITECTKALNENLFIVNPSLRPALLNVREMCHRISDMGLCKVEKGNTYALSQFREAQFTQLTEVAGRLSEFRDLVKEVVRSACRTALLEAGFTPDDYYMADDGANSPGLGDMAPGTSSSYMMPSNYDMDIYGEAPDRMTYTEQANKRAHCKRLTCFIRLADYLIVNTMHVLAVNSVSTLLNYLSEQLQSTPTLEQIQAFAEEAKQAADELKEDPETREEKKAEKARQEKEKAEKGKHEEQEDEEGHQLPPLFITEFVLEPNQLLFAPDSDDFQEGLAEVIKKFQDAVLSVQNLVPDNYFDAFTHPIINNKFEEKTCGDGPSLSTMFEDDKHQHHRGHQELYHSSFQCCL